VLDNVSLSIPAHKMTAIVGASGSGKSTIASLIPRLYDTDLGSICVDGCNVKEMRLQHLRSLSAVVEQSTSLHQGSILENVAVGLLASDQHTHLRQAILDGRLSALVSAVRGGQELNTAMQDDSLLEEIVELVREAIESAEAAVFVKRLQHGLTSDAGHNGPVTVSIQWSSTALGSTATSVMRYHSCCEMLTAQECCERSDATVISHTHSVTGSSVPGKFCICLTVTMFYAIVIT
jgi:ATP-binding cassette, subfamily B (MDR/TAP), member 1